MKFIILVMLVLASPAAFAQEGPEPTYHGIEDPDASEEHGGAKANSAQEPPEENGQTPRIVHAPALSENQAPVQAERQSREDRQEEREIADLDAQQRMAVWAGWSSVFSGVAAFASIFAAGLLYRTLYVTRQVSRDQSRAYLTLTGAKFEFIGMSGEEMPCGRNDAYQFVGTVKNFGATPTEEFYVSYQLQHHTRNAGGGLTKGATFNELTPRWHGPGPGMDNSFPICTPEMVNFIHVALDAGGEDDQLVLTGTVACWTVYEEFRTQRFRMSLDLDRARTYRSRFKEIYARQEGAMEPIRLQFAVLDSSRPD